MPPTNPKEWLVRTRTGEILGPYSALDLMAELNQQTFSLDDEIAPSEGRWVSAQSLAHHDSEEVTRTSTRNVTTNGSTVSSSLRSISGNLAEKTDEVEDLTPTPEPSRAPKAYHAVSNPTVAPTEKHWLKRGLPFISLILIGTGIYLVLSQRSPNLSEEIITSINSPLLHPDSSDQTLKSAYRAIALGQSQQAITTLSSEIGRDPSKAIPDHLIPYAALLIMEENAIPRSQKLLDQVIRSDQSSVMTKSLAYRWIGYSQLTSEEGDFGENAFLESLQSNPKDPISSFNLGRAYLKQEKYAQALDYLRLSELEMPHLWLVHIYKGRAKVAIKEVQEARSSFRMAVQSAPDRWLTYIYHAIFLMSLKERQQAQAVLKNMLTRDPQYEILSPVPWGYYQEKVNYEEYAKVFEHVTSSGAAELRELGRAYLSYLTHPTLADSSKRIEALAEKGTLVSRVLALKTQLNRGATPDELTTMMGRLPENLNEFGYYAYVVRGDAKLRLGQSDAAKQDYLKSLEIEPHNAVGHLRYAELLNAQGKSSDAALEIQTLLVYHPNYIPALKLAATLEK